jgi:hypothetical protein
MTAIFMSQCSLLFQTRLRSERVTRDKILLMPSIDGGLHGLLHKTTSFHQCCTFLRIPPALILCLSLVPFLDGAEELLAAMIEPTRL